MVMKKVGFPALGEGLDAQLSPHFGHVDSFILVQYDENTKNIVNVESVPNVAHQMGGCMAPVNVLKESGVDSVVLGGIGMQPLMFFLEEGIAPYKGALGTVKQNFDAFINNKLNTLQQGTCGGSH